MPHRQRRSADQWKVLIAEYEQSDETLESFCNRRELAVSTFSRWRGFIRVGEQHTPAPSAFKQVVTTAPPADNEASATARLTGPQIVLNIGDQITLSIHTGDSQ